MGTLTEIEIVVDRLPLADQEKLLRHLEATLQQKRNGRSESREDWMERLEILRGSISTGQSTQTGEQILEDLRGE